MEIDVLKEKANFYGACGLLVSMPFSFLALDKHPIAFFVIGFFGIFLGEYVGFLFEKKCLNMPS